MKTILTLALLSFSASSFSNITNIETGHEYIGEEAVNDHFTGNQCSITIKEVKPVTNKGLHCHSISFGYDSVRSDIPTSALKTTSRVTNYHRSEYPDIKTCAVNIDGTTYGDEIYSNNTDILYNKIHGGAHRVKRTQFDYFISTDPRTKQASRVRVNIMTTLKEYYVDCLNLRLK